MQTLNISGRCCIQLANMPGYTERALTRDIGLGKGTGLSILDLMAPKPVETTYYVAAWTGSNNYTYSPVCKDTGQIYLSVSIPDGHPDMLKLAVLGRAYDDETQLTKNFYLLSAALDLRKPSTKVILSSPFDTNKVNLHYTCSPIDPSRLSASALRYVDTWNKKNADLSKSMLESLAANKVHIPEAARGFAQAITYLPGGGGDIPDISVHDGVLSAVVDRLNRQVPHVLLAYFLHVYFVHHGYTAKQLLDMDDDAFTREMFKIFAGPTRDAAFNPYQPDRTWDVSDKTGGMMTSENIGNPLPASVGIGAKLETRKLPPLPDVEADWKAGDYASVFKKMGSYLHEHSVEPQEMDELFLMMDDCETSWQMIQRFIATVMRGDMSKYAFESECTSHPCFVNYNEADFDLVSKIFSRCQRILLSKKVSTGSVIGLAGGASASSISASGGVSVQDINEVQDAGGHCFGFAKLQTPSSMYVRLIEGTTCLDEVHVDSTTPKYTVGNPANPSELQTLEADQFLTCLSKAFGSRSQIINSVIADGHEGTGIKTKRPIAGFARDQVHIKSLRDHQPNEDMMFYKWIMFAGLSKPSIAGVLPIDDRNTPGGLEFGCHPALFASNAVNGFPAAMSEADINLGARILEEAWEPQLHKDHVKKVMALWHPLPGSLSKVNEGAPHPDGYYRVTCMESPVSPELKQALFHMHCALANVTNKINSETKDSDGISIKVTAIGTGVHKTLIIPKISTHMTFIASLEEAKLKLKWTPNETILSSKLQKHITNGLITLRDHRNVHGKMACAHNMGCNSDCPSGGCCRPRRRRHHKKS